MGSSENPERVGSGISNSGKEMSSFGIPEDTGNPCRPIKFEDRADFRRKIVVGHLREVWS